MNLKMAASYFAHTPIEGWNGYSWVATSAKGALLPFDRSTVDSDFRDKRRLLLVNSDTPIPVGYHAIRLAGSLVYLLGALNQDLRTNVYSHIYHVHLATAQAEVLRFRETTYASGVGGKAIPVIEGTYYTDLTYRTSIPNKVLEGTMSPHLVAVLPRDCDVSPENELLVNGVQYQIEDIIEVSGFLQCNLIMRHPS